jgi:Zn-dependent M28 family amino/carboxypeptidase
MTKRHLLSLFTFLLLSVWASAQEDETLLRNWIQTLASDEFGGRKPMTSHETLTINYLAGELNRMGLEPAFNGSWFQPFQLVAVTAQPDGNKVTVKGKKKAQLKYPEDLVIWTARATDRVELSKAEYVFCGFGIHAPEYGWDDYAGIDVKGKIVIAMVNDPGYYDASLFRGRNMTYYGRWIYKFEEAMRQGAAGCLVLHNTEAASYGWHVCVNGHMENNLALYNPDTHNAGELAVKGWLHEDGARKIFAAAGLDMDTAIAAAQKPGFQSFSLKVRGDVKMAVSYDIHETHNVGALLRGTDRADEVVVLCAHWDHLGMGTPDADGDTIYNGAADNASGMAGALLSALKIIHMPTRPRRSILFLFPSSEESGLFGSEYYCAHPVVPMDKTVACLNFESIGPAELTRDLAILGGGESRLDRYYEAAAAAQGRYIFYDDDNSDGWFYRSDHYNFVKKGVPAVVWENGKDLVDPSRPNKYPMPVWYHKPSDEYRPDWDLAGTVANVRLLTSVALSLANTD